MMPIKNVILTLALAIGLTPSVSEAKYYNSSPELQTEKVLTPLDPIELATNLRSAYVDVFGKTPSDNVINVAWAQVSTENGQGSVMWNNNFGNIGPKLGEQWYAHSSTESYRSFDTPIAGAIAYWKLIYSRCRGAFKSFKTGNPEQASIALKACNYYGADVDQYTKLMTTLYWYAKRKILPALYKQIEQELSMREKQERELRVQFTPTCGCSMWF